jgi:hypothetical protein
MDAMISALEKNMVGFKWVVMSRPVLLLIS